MTGLARDFPASDFNRAYVTRPLVASVVGDLGPILIIVMSATGLLLLLACVNVTNLLLARGAARAREMARARRARRRPRPHRPAAADRVGAAVRRGRGCSAAWLWPTWACARCSRSGRRSCRASMPSTFDGRVLLFALATLVVSGLLVGFAPALRLAGTDVRTLMSESTRSASGGRAHGALAERDDGHRDRARDHAGGGSRLAGARLRRPAQRRPGVRRREAPALRRLVPRARSIPTPSRRRESSRQLTRSPGGAARASPRVGATSNFPLRNAPEGSLIAQFHGEPLDPAIRSARGSVSSARATSRRPARRLLQGRDFGPDDRREHQPVAIVNQAFVNRYLTGRDPIGMRVLGRISRARSEPTKYRRRRGRRRAAEERERRSGAGVLCAADAGAVAPADGGRGDVARPTSRRCSRPSAGRCGGSIRNIAVEFELVDRSRGGDDPRQQLGMTLMLIFGLVAMSARRGRHLRRRGVRGVAASRTRWPRGWRSARPRAACSGW